ncbi:MAG: hypothetical protein DHS20C14_01780 [Phycisphaeraceae bacterium]|nr:MAG: hypothetical protein DHS20C14_01780 [Phycisphaeraceae bacterium]
MNLYPARVSIAALAILAAAAGSAHAQQRAVRGPATPERSAVGESPDVALRLLGAPSGGVAGDADTVLSDALWDNGLEDRAVGYMSTVNDHVESRVADDCWLKEGMFYDCQFVYVRMAITNGYTPNTTLSIFPDCDGKPDSSLATVPIEQFDFTLVDGAPGGELEGYAIWEISYYVDSFKQGEDLRWFSPAHDSVDRGQSPIGGFGFWMSANKGQIQGRQAHVNAPAFGLPEWSPAADELCCGICTDMYMRVEGKCCWRVLDQLFIDTTPNGGLYDPILSQNAPWNRSFDDFQLSDPCGEIEEWGICRIEAFVATNCDISTLYAEIYNNVCDMPENSPDAALYKFAPTSIFESDIPLTVEGLRVYGLTFVCPEGVVLASGHNYWLTIFSEQGFAAGKRTVWLFEGRRACNIRLNEAKYRNAPIGFDMPTPVSDPALHGAPRGHAFGVWVCEPEVTTTGDDG